MASPTAAAYDYSHYVQGYFETIYEIRDILGQEGFKAFCMGNYIKYSARAQHKGNYLEDAAKAQQYLLWAVNGLPDPVNGRVPRDIPNIPSNTVVGTSHTIPDSEYYTMDVSYMQRKPDR